MVAASRSDETFVALCLLTVTGASLLTQRLGFSDTMGAFAAGVLLSETNFRSQVRCRANRRGCCCKANLQRLGLICGECMCHVHLV